MPAFPPCELRRSVLPGQERLRLAEVAEALHQRGVRVHERPHLFRLDMAVRAGGQVYLFEFKVVEQAGEGPALAQLVERGYAEKYAGQGALVHLVGVEFSSRTRNVERFEVRRA